MLHSTPQLAAMVHSRVCHPNRAEWHGSCRGKAKIPLVSKPMGTFLRCEEGAAGAGDCGQEECNAQPHCLETKRNVSGEIILFLAVKWEPRVSAPNNERQTTVH